VGFDIRAAVVEPARQIALGEYAKYVVSYSRTVESHNVACSSDVMTAGGPHLVTVFIDVVNISAFGATPSPRKWMSLYSH